MQLKNEEIKVTYGQKRGTCKDRVVLKIERNSPEVPVAAATEWPPPRSLKRPRRQRRSNQKRLSSFSFSDSIALEDNQWYQYVVSEPLHKRGLRASKEANAYLRHHAFFMAIYDVFPSLNYFLMVIALIVVLCQSGVIIINFT